MIKKEILLIIAFLFFIGININCDVTNKVIIRKHLFDLNWKFNKGKQVFASEVNFDDQSWNSLDLPHDWSIDTKRANSSLEYPFDSISSEIGWYRKDFEIPKDWFKKIIIIDFEGIGSNSEIFVNGITINDSNDEDCSFQTILNPYLNSSGENIIAVRVVNSTNQDGTSPSESGIYKHVWLIIKDSQE